MSVLLSNTDHSTPPWYEYTNLSGQAFTYVEQTASEAADEYEERNAN